MTEPEINRAIQYVIASTSYGRETIAEIVRTGLSELETLATRANTRFERDTLMEYVCQWTIKRTGHPEPLVREVLGCAGRWLNELYEAIAREHPEWLQSAEN
ncbi:MAG: hypothetical protein ACT4OO_09270 [Nitrospiraceae bacterium]